MVQYLCEVSVCRISVASLMEESCGLSYRKPFEVEKYADVNYPFVDVRNNYPSVTLTSDVEVLCIFRYACWHHALDLLSGESKLTWRFKG